MRPAVEKACFDSWLSQAYLVLSPLLGIQKSSECYMLRTFVEVEVMVAWMDENSVALMGKLLVRPAC